MHLRNSRARHGVRLPAWTAALLAIAFLILFALQSAGPVAAQGAAATRPATEIGPITNTGTDTGASRSTDIGRTTLPPAIKAPAAPVWVGRWGMSVTDKETQVTDRLTIEFMADGHYQARTENSHFPSPRKPGRGRYAVSNADKSGFVLRIERHLEDPEVDRRQSAATQRITVLDQDRLQAEDGSIIHRLK